jgi:hypothetical protein
MWSVHLLSLMLLSCFWHGVALFSCTCCCSGGGDGTLNEVVGAMMQHREAIVRQGLSIALIPLGTANDFACTAGISVVGSGLVLPLLPVHASVQI